MTVNIGYDFEFLEHEVSTYRAGEDTPRKVMTIEPISIGLKVYAGGPAYYAVFRDAPWAEIARSKFLMEQVVPKLPGLSTGNPGDWMIDLDHPDVKSRGQIAAEVLTFLRDALKAAPQFTFPTLSLWADYCAFDHVSLAWLWGTMVNLPEGVPMRTNDLMQLADSLGVPESALPVQNPATAHHSGHDARHGEVVYDYLRAVERAQRS